MRHPVNALRPDLVRTAHAARTAKAAELFGRDILRERMQAAAGGGFDTVTIPGPAGVDLRGTEAANDAETWLRGEGIEFRWDPRTGASGADAAGGFDLVLTWRAAVASGLTAAGADSRPPG